MEPIRDLTWLKHLHTGAVIERFRFHGYRALALRIPSSEKFPQEQYLYRMLFFPDAGTKPVLSLNLELSILGSYCLTEQAGVRHRRFDTVGEPVSYEEFKQWALARANRELEQPELQFVQRDLVH